LPAPYMKALLTVNGFFSLLPPLRGGTFRRFDTLLVHRFTKPYS
jgi:hypothetical protein